MAFRVSRLGHLFIKAESAFSTDAFGGTDPTAAQRLEVEDLSFEPTQEFIARTAQTQQLGQVAGQVGVKGGKIKFKVPLRSLGRGDGDAVLNGSGASSDSDVGGALAVALAAAGLLRIQQRGAAADADQTGMDQNTIKLASQGKFGGDGGAPFITIKKSGKLEVRLCEEVVTGVTQTVHPDWSGAPANSQAVFGADSWYPRPDASDIAPNSAPGTVTMIVKKDGHQYTCTGCMAAPPKISVDAGKRIMLELEYMVDDWDATSTYALPGEELTKVHPAMLAKETLVHYGVSANPAAPVPVASFEFDFGVTLTPIAATHGKNGRCGWAPTEMKPSLKLKTYFDPAWRTAYAARTVDQVLIQIGNSEGYTAALALRYCQITGYPGEVDLDGKVGHELQFTPVLDIAGGLWRPVYLGLL